MDTFEWLLVLLVPAIWVGLFYFYFKFRTHEFKSAASDLGFTFCKTLNYDLNQLSDFYLFINGRSRKIGVGLVGKDDGIDVKMFEYSFLEEGERFFAFGDGPATIIQTVILFESKDLYFPKFHLRPKERCQKKFEYKGQQIHFDSHPKFSSNYLLQGEDVTSIRRLFNKDILSYFTNQEKDMSVEGFGNKLICYTYCSQAKKISNFLNKGVKVFYLFKSNSKLI